MNREELYALVWEEPVTHVAEKFGISDVAVRKICVNHGVPTPPLGYWAKLQHGKKVDKIPLPPLAKGQSDHIELRIHPTKELPPTVAEVYRVAAAEQDREENRIIVPTERPDKLHPIALSTEKVLRKAKPDGEGFVGSDGPGLFDTKIGPDSIDRTVIIIHVLLQAAVDHGHAISTDCRIVVDEQPLAIRIYETKDKVSHIATPADLKAQAIADEDHRRLPSLYPSRQVYRSWDYVPSGRLMLEISDPKLNRWNDHAIVGRWRDRKTTRLEEYLGDVMTALKTGGAIARHQRAEEAEKARRAKEAEDRRREQEAQRRLFDRLLTYLSDKAGKHDQLSKIENLAGYLTGNDEGVIDAQYPELARALKFVVANLRHQISAESMNEEILEKGLLNPDRW